MKRFCPIVAYHGLLLVLTLIAFAANGEVTVTGPSNGTCLDVKPGVFKTLGNITITEVLKNDLPVQTNQTLVLTAPAGFEFNPGIGTVLGQIPAASGNISAMTMVVTSNTITVTLTVSAVTKWDYITISGIQVIATSYNVSGNILRLSGSGGNATIVGNAPGSGISHGYLESEKAPAIYSIIDGNWTNPATWSGGFVPTCIDTVYIRHLVTVDANASARTVVVENTGILYGTNALTIDTLFRIDNGGYYIHNNTSVGSTTIFKGTEQFATASNILIQRWHDVLVPFPTGVSGNFGNISFNQGLTWSQNGLFAPARIKGTLTVSSGNIVMDDGTGMTTTLTLQDVVVNGTGALIMAAGANRNLNLTTNNYTDVSTSGTRSVMIRNSQGNLTWTANGNVYVSHHFSAYQHSGSNPGNTNITINGDLTIAGGMFTINYNVDAPLTLNVTGTTRITGTPNYVRFIDSPTGSLNFTTNNFIIEGGNSTELVGGNSPTGNAIINVLNDFHMSGASTEAIFYINAVSPGSLTFNIGRDAIITGGLLTLANSNGNVIVSAGRNMIISGASTSFIGQRNNLTTTMTDLDITGYFQLNNGTFTLNRGRGLTDIDVVEDIIINGGYFYGSFNSLMAANSNAELNCENLNFNGGYFSFFNSTSTTGNTVTINCNTDFNINFQSSTDFITFVGITAPNSALLDMNIAYNMTITGNYPGSMFVSSASSGAETVDIGGMLSVYAGDVFFTGNETGLTASHSITTNITGDVIIAGGNTRLSTGAGTATITVNGNVDLSNGILSLKYSTGSGNMSVNGNYIQSGGQFNIHAANVTTSNISTVTVNGDFLMTNGTFNFETFAASSGLAEHALYINGDNYTLDGNAVITHANNLTTNYIFGQIYFTKPGTTVYTRSSSTNDIRHVKYTINSGTTVDATSSSNGFQMTSVTSSSQTFHICLNIYGVLNMGSQVVSARQQANYYSRLTVRNNGRYRLSHTGGLYSGDILLPSSIDGYISGNNRVSYNLESSSIVEYYGTSIMKVTGIPNGYAAGNAQKYGFLEINHTGTPGSSWVYPETSGEVYVRSRLVLTEGEFNLDDDHVTANGGRIITLETGCTINRTNGFIRSETEDGSGRLAWSIPANGTYSIPFGYDHSTYIPFTYQQTSGSTGLLEVGTFRTLNNNTPYPPTVTHVNDVNGVNNSAQTVDRFWNIIAPGVATANITFTYAVAESDAVLSPRAQLWEPVTTGWFPPSGIQSNPTGNTTQAGGITLLNNWWTLSSAASPLPVELISFEALKENKSVLLRWSTASEIDNDHFTIERGNNGFDFEPIGLIAGAGNSTSVIHYEFRDSRPENGINYYRLVQYDFDGTATRSDVKTVDFGKDQIFSVFPNPASANTSLTMTVPGSGEYKLTIYDVTGRMLLEENLTADETGTIKANTEQIFRTAGVYHLSLSRPDENHNHKVLIK